MLFYFLQKLFGLFAKEANEFFNEIYIQGISRVIMNPTEFEMQPTIHLQNKPGYFQCRYPGLLCKCIVGCIFNSVALIITC
jgi:hypothetical protein